MTRIPSIIFLLLVAQFVSAQVQLSSGGFFVSYDDLSFPSNDWTASRNYHSLSKDNGLFGTGWGTNLATRLWHLPDGQIEVIHWGTGRTDHFLPVQFNRSGIYRMIDSIVKVELKNKFLQQSPKNIIRRRAELYLNHSERAQVYISFLKDNQIAFEETSKKEEEQWYKQFRETETITWVKNNYLLKLFDQEILFNKNGLMVHQNNDKVDIKYIYDEKQRLSSILTIKDSANVTLDSLGHILTISYNDSTGKTLSAKYTYNSRGLLIQSVDVDNNRYKYEYDLNFNMIITRYADSSYRRIEYDPATNRVIVFKEKNGDSTLYEYGYLALPDGRLNLDHYYTSILQFDSNRKRRFSQYEEKEFRLTDNGKSYLYRQINKKDSIYKVNIYPPKVGNAIYRRINNREAWCTYDSKSRPIYLKIKDSIFITRYNIQNLPVFFQAIDSVKKDTIDFKYFYNTKEQLEKVVRNKTSFYIKGSSESGEIFIGQGTKKWKIEFKNGNPYYFTNYTSKRYSIEELEKPENGEIKKSFNEILLLIIPQKIEHEWIWERFVE